MIPVSICLIAKNEEKYIEECLKRLRKYDWEIIVTDTGSTDNTISIAEQYADKVYHFDWINDFSAARNFCIAKASYEWILNIDCDEYLTYHQEAPSLKSMLEAAMQHPEKLGMLPLTNPLSASGGSESIERIPRFFHKEYYTYTGSIHEQPTALKAKDSSYFDLELPFYHMGYANQATLNQKAQRNIQLLEKALESTPNDPYLYFQLGQSYYVMNNAEKACHYFDQGLSLPVDTQLQYVKTMVVSYGYSLLQQKEYAHALQFEGIYDAFCNYADFVFLMGLIYMNNALFPEAIEQFERATTLRDYSVVGTNSHLAYYNAGVIYECLGQKEKAAAFYQKCNSYEPAIQGLARVCP